MNQRAFRTGTNPKGWYLVKSPPWARWTVLCALGATVFAAAPAALAAPRRHKGKFPPALAEILSRMNDARKNLKTLSANLDYTKVTVLVNDKSTESGQFFFRKGKIPEMMMNMQKPDAKSILFKKNRAEIYLPKINQIQEYDLEQHSGLIQEFLLLGFGTETGELTRSYNVKFLNEEDLEGDSTAVLELTPRRESVAAHISKVQLWISEESWLPVQQKFFEPGGDYLIALYKGVKVNRQIPASTFQIVPAKGAKRVRIN